MQKLKFYKGLLPNAKPIFKVIIIFVFEFFVLKFEGVIVGGPQGIPSGMKGRLGAIFTDSLLDNDKESPPPLKKGNAIKNTLDGQSF